MSIFTNTLMESLHTGYIDKFLHSDKNLLPQILVNDKKNGIKVLSTIDDELRKCDEFWFSVAFLTNSGIAALINTLQELEDRNIKGKVLVSQYLNFTQPIALEKLIKFKNLEVKIAVTGNFHSKGYLFKRNNFYNLIIGSSNLTSAALSSNKEWNLKITAAKGSHIISVAEQEFEQEFKNAILVTAEFIEEYGLIYRAQIQNIKTIGKKLHALEIIEPNRMQTLALENLKLIRRNGSNKALLISATGTGKTYLSAFDVKNFQPKKFLFVVHRENIARAAMKTFRSIFGETVSMGLYTGISKNVEADYIFSTIQTISKETHHSKFTKNHFDYIVIDESHHAGADSYQSILNYFTPKFLLGMTATPERTDGLDIFKLFDYQIAYEIRLHEALSEEMLSPFHYYGVTDISVNDEVIKTKDFSLLTSNERISHIIDRANFYGCDDGIVRGLIFCSGIAECKQLSENFNQRGYRTIALTGDNTETERAIAIEKLEAETPKLDYIFTVDIFNEGIDIPKVNQVIMLRPTQSAIVFVQQLGRGLRKIEGKDYLTVIDFIGNYNNNYLVPIALYGDTTYNKDTLRKLMSSGSNLIPGSSTINFDKISKDRIFQAIDSANMQLKKDLVNDYKLLKFKLGRVPMMVDFVEHGSRDPQLYVNYSKSYFNFVKSIENEYSQLDKEKEKLLELFACEINNSKRVEESILLKILLQDRIVNKTDFKKIIFSKYGYSPSDRTIDSCINNLNFQFVTENYNKKLIPVGDIYDIRVVKIEGENISFETSFRKHLFDEILIRFLKDNTEYAIQIFDKLFQIKKFQEGFILYRKYSRKDVFRILNWNQNPLAQNVGGSAISSDGSNCSIFVNYHKEDHISSTTKYEDHFINNFEFAWMSKSNRTLSSKDILTIRNTEELRIALFVKKSNDEGTDFYYMGNITPVDSSFEQGFLKNDQGKKVSVVKITYAMSHPVEENIYNYITDQSLVDV